MVHHGISSSLLLPNMSCVLLFVIFLLCSHTLHFILSAAILIVSLFQWRLQRPEIENMGRLIKDFSCGLVNTRECSLIFTCAHQNLHTHKQLRAYCTVSNHCPIRRLLAIGGCFKNLNPLSQQGAVAGQCPASR